MQERALRVLEFVKIRDQLSSLAICEPGAVRCASLMPSSDLDTVNRWQQETEEALVVLQQAAQHPLIPFSDIANILNIAAIGGTLSPRSLLDVCALMRASRAARDALCTERENTPGLIALSSGLSTFRRVEEDIQGAILSEDEIADNASTELASIRRHMRLCNDRVREKLNAILRSSSMQKHLQDTLITQRGDRYVIPVKVESRQFVPGLVHDQSSSGATLFIEPMAVVEIGNDLKQWIAKESAEIERILSALSARIAPEVPMLLTNIEILSELDFRFAKARLSRQMRASLPKINDRGFISIVRGRHPLIDPAAVVPINLWMGDGFTTLVITGPNTGGKTVTLKTVGLFTLMAMAGLQVPADFGTQLSIFDEVFADIGDEQSIEQSLSTFSSHMVNIVGIIGAVTSRSLALFDELGAGTDPTEGAALAEAILTRLLAKGTRTLATTHYSELKAYALTTAGVENASAEFDVETLRPTYRLSIGIPGKSNAFEISRRLGLPAEVIDDAKAMLSRDQVRFEDVIANAEYHRQIAERERALAEEARLSMNRARDDADKERERFQMERDKQLVKAREEARGIVERARRESESVIAELKRMKKEGGAARDHEIHAAEKTLLDAAGELNAALSAPTFSAQAPPQNLKLGESVLLMHLGTRGTVVTLPNAQGEVTVQAGILKLKAHISQIKRDGKAARAQVTTRTDIDMTTRSAALSCDVRGMNLDEAIEAVEKYLDDALLSSLSEVTIVHGKGTGTLRQGIATQLKKHPRVKSLRLGKFGEGEEGVTVVTLK